MWCDNTAAAGYNNANEGTEGVVGYWNNAISLTGYHPPTWKGQVADETFVDVAISNDGDYVVVAGAGEAGPSTVYYWASATSRSGKSEPYTWAGGVNVIFTSVDMSCDGDSVIAGARIEPEDHNGGPLAGSVYFWGGATHLIGTPDPSWTYPTLAPVEDVAINDAGTYMAAVDYEVPDTLYFFDRQGNVLWHDVDIKGAMLSISCDGGTLAVGHYPFTTAYLLDTGYSSPCCGEVEPVGGAVMPVNTLATLGPWLVVVGLVGCIGTVVVVAKKPKN